MTSSLLINIGIFAIAALVIGVVGVRASRLADRLADLTGWGEAIVGAIFLGGSTSLPGIVTSVTAAWTGYPELSASNAVGGIAAQTAFLAIADITYRRANLEHAAVSVPNLVQCGLLITLLSLPLLAINGPDITVLQIHPMSLILIGGYAYGLRLLSQVRQQPMWGPRQTDETFADEGSEDEQSSSAATQLWLRFAFFAVMLGTAGYAVAESGIAIAEMTGLSETAVGGIFTAVSTSLPELVTSIAAVQQGALTLAIGDIIGGNSFDVLFLAFADIAYREGSIYHAIASQQAFLSVLAILMTGILLLGLLRREKYGLANIGLESVLILLLYFGGFVIVFLQSQP